MLTAIVLAKNEQRGIRECLKSLSFADKIIVIDDFSTDRTRDVARRLGARVYKRRLQNNFAAQRNFGLKKAGAGWVIFVDSDERVTASLQTEILRAVKKRNYAGYLIPRQDWLYGKKLRYGETSQIKLLRLARKSAGSWKRAVHETWEAKGRIGELSSSLRHQPHPVLNDFLQEINRYSDLHALSIVKEGKTSNLFKITIFPIGKFFQNYFLRFGFLDGMPGLVIALMMSLHSFLSWGKLYQIQKAETR